MQNLKEMTKNGVLVPFLWIYPLFSEILDPPLYIDLYRGQSRNPGKGGPPFGTCWNEGVHKVKYIKLRAKKGILTPLAPL